MLLRDAALSLRTHVAVGSGLGLNALLGRGTMRALPGFEARARWPREAFLPWRDARLRELLAHARAHVPGYRERIPDFGPHDDPMSVLARVPVLTKDDLRADRARFFATDEVRRVRECSTSGSTGSPIVIAQDDAMKQWVRAAQRRAYRWYGVEPMAPRMLLLAAPQDLKARLRARVIDTLTFRRLYTFHDLSPDVLADVARDIRRYRPPIVAGYPSVLARLAWTVVDRGETLRDAGVKLLHAQSEMLDDTHRDVLARAFGPVPILDEYGCVEVGAMAHSCPAGRLHPAHDTVVLEVVDDDGRPVRPGEAGRVLLTPLPARAMPLVRYDVGDRAVVSREASCPCGVFPGMPLLERIEGRTFDVIVADDGHTFSAGIVHFLVRTAGLAPHVREYLARQRTPGVVEFLVVPAASAPADLAARLGERAREVFTGGVRVDVAIVDEIPRDARKKRAYFISELGPRPGARSASTAEAAA